MLGVTQPHKRNSLNPRQTLFRKLPGSLNNNVGIRSPSFRLCVRNTENGRAEPPLDDGGVLLRREAQIRRQGQNEDEVTT